MASPKRPDGRGVWDDLCTDDTVFVNAIRAAGLKPKQVTEIVHVLSLPTVAEVRSVTRQVREVYRCEVRSPLRFAEDWRVAAHRGLDGLSSEYLREARELFEALAADHGGIYVGWYVPVQID